MKKILISLALVGLIATNAEAHGGGHYYHGGYHGGGSSFFFGAALGAALTLPFYYAYSRAWAEPGPYYYYNPGPPLYVQSQPVYVQRQPNYVVVANPPGNVVMPAQSNGVIEHGPVANPAPAQSNTAPNMGSDEARADQWFVYPSRGQNQQQAANDRYDCGKWATNQSGYDPDLRVHRNPQTGPIAYGRALSACLEGRGYTVR